MSLASTLTKKKKPNPSPKRDIVIRIGSDYINYDLLVGQDNIDGIVRGLLDEYAEQLSDKQFALDIQSNNSIQSTLSDIHHHIASSQWK